MEELNEITKRRLKEAMDDKLLTNADLSRKTTLSRAAISQYVTGSYTPSTRAAQLMADTLGVSPKWLMGLSDEKYSKEKVWVNHSLTFEVKDPKTPNLPEFEIDVVNKESSPFESALNYLDKNAQVIKSLYGDELELIELWRSANFTTKTEVYKLLKEGKSNGN